MTKFLPYARLALLAGLTSLTLTSCFDHDKKCDPKPRTCGTASTPSTPNTGSSGGGSN